MIDEFYTVTDALTSIIADVNQITAHASPISATSQSRPRRTRDAIQVTNSIIIISRPY